MHHWKLMLMLSATIAATALTSTNALAANAPKLVFLKLQANGSVGGLTKTAAEDAVETQLNKAAPERGWALVPLRRVRGLEGKARRCKTSQCRVGIAKRLRATHILHGTIRKKGRMTFVDLILEDTSGKILRAKTIEGRALSLPEKVRIGVDQLLEETSPKEATARARLLKIADSYASAKRAKDEVRTLQRALQLNPFHAEAGPIQARIVTSWARSGEFDKAKDETERFMDMYGPLSAWAKTSPKDVKERAQVAGRKAAIVTGTEAHRRARAFEESGQLTNEVVKRLHGLLHKVAADSYIMIRRNWPRSKERPEATVYLADLRFDEGQYGEAAELYIEAQHDPLRQQVATLGLVYTYERMLTARHPELSPSQPLPKLLPKKAVQVPAAARRYVESVDSLATLAPSDPTRAAHQVSAGKVYLTLGHVAEGKKRLAFVVKHFPKSSAGEVAASVLKNLKKVASTP